MFTGIVEELGKVISMEKTGDGYKFVFSAGKILKDLKRDNSVAVNGTCLTIVERGKNTFSSDVMRETLKKTNLGLLRTGSQVNLERAVSLRQRLGGHLMLGHVDGTGTIEKRIDWKDSWLFTVSFEKKFRKYFIPVGSVAVDGVSLTVARLHQSSFEVSIIPYTMENTLFHSYKKGSQVNLEFDMIGKYIESIMKYSEKPR